MQQQSGVYGAIVIEPLQNGPKPDRDYVVMLSITAPPLFGSSDPMFTRCSFDLARMPNVKM